MAYCSSRLDICREGQSPREARILLAATGEEPVGVHTGEKTSRGMGSRGLRGGSRPGPLLTPTSAPEGRWGEGRVVVTAVNDPSENSVKL